MAENFSSNLILDSPFITATKISDDDSLEEESSSSKLNNETNIPKRIINFLQSITDVLFDESDQSDEVISSTTMANQPAFPKRTIGPLQKLFDIDKMINSNPNSNVDISSPPYSTRSNPDILIFDVKTPSESDASSTSSSSSIITPSNVTNFFNNVMNSNSNGKPPAPPPLPTIFSQTIMPTIYNNDPIITTTSTTTMMNENEENRFFNFGPTCFSSPEDYELIPSMLCSSLVVLGVVYFTYGYRCFRAFAFFVGLIFGATLFHTVCIAENIHLLPGYSWPIQGNMIASLIAGIILGLFTMLVIYIGLFVIGIHLGLLVAIAFLIVIYLLRPYYLVLQAPLSALTLLIFFVSLSLVGALTTVYFSKGCTILASSMYGSALTLLCADYFLEGFKVIHWFLDQLSNGNDWYGLLVNIKRGQTLCLGSHILLILWPMFTMFGLLIQSCCTAKHYEYRQGYGMVDNGSANGSTGAPILSASSFARDRSLHHYQNSNNFHHLSTNSRNSSDLEEARLEQRHRKYRYLYQVRTAHGDVISQHYLQSLQNKKQQLCLPDQDSFTFNSDLSSHFLPSESRTTTLSVA